MDKRYGMSIALLPTRGFNWIEILLMMSGIDIYQRRYLCLSGVYFAIDYRLATTW